MSPLLLPLGQYAALEVGKDVRVENMVKAKCVL
jgi:hypothetical protein